MLLGNGINKALSYRYFLKGINVTLSPQHELSCYIKDCDHGNVLIDPQLSLIKNGTLTEECLPFSSGKKQIESCPSTCKDPKVEYKKYYAKNAYAAYMNKNNIYDITAIIIDQLINNGPVITLFTVYKDFQQMSDFDYNCPNKVYSYDGKSKEVGGHVVTIVGYGLLNNKYYWLIQNSWGEKACKGGFHKIEFGQVGIGSISFSEPYIEEEESTDTMNIQFLKLSRDCSLEITSNNNLDNWKSQLEIIFKHKEKSSEFNYICGVNKILNDSKKIFCNFEINNKETAFKGEYIYDSFTKIGKENNFSLDDSFLGKNFTFFGGDTYKTITSELNIPDFNNNYYFVSEEGSRFSFIYKPAGIDKDMVRIFSYNSKVDQPLTNCKKSTIYIDRTTSTVIAYCEITNDELDLFDEYSPQIEGEMINRYFCGQYIYMNFAVFKLDKAKYPVLKVTNFIISHTKMQKFYYFNLTLNIEGSVSGCSDSQNNFIILVNVEKNNVNNTNVITCSIANPQIMKNYQMLCGLDSKVEFDNIYLLPYYNLLQFNYPIEIIIKNEIKGYDKDNISPTPSNAYVIHSSLLFLLLIGLLI